MELSWALRQTATPLLFSTLLISGCAHQQNPVIPSAPSTVPIPEQWQAPLAPSIEMNQGWLTTLGSPELVALVNQALQHNHTVEHAALLQQLAAEQTQLDDHALAPTTQGKISTTRARANSAGVATHSSTLGLELSTVWETDLWNRLSDQRRATALREEASVTDLRAARLSIAAQVAQGWFAALSSKQQIELSEERLNGYRKAEKIIENRYSQGITDALDLHLARSEVALAEEQLARHEMEFQQQLRRLEILSGEYPAAKLQVAGPLPQLESNVPAGIPASMLERRPDIHASQLQLQAASLERAIAAKNRLPSLSLTIKGGTSSSELNQLLNWDYLVWNLLGSLTQPLFQQEKLKSEERLKQIAQRQAEVKYAETLLLALQEVENALATDEGLKTRAAALKRAAKESQQGATLALSRYQGGLIDVLTLLDAQQRSYDRQSAYLQTLSARIDNRIQLHLALGGELE